MKTLAMFDAQNYHDTTEVYEKYTVRGIIMQNGKLAMQYGSGGEYKIPGGGPEEGEDFVQALIREVHEETGLCVVQDSIVELGEMVELRRDIFDHKKKYICHTLFYYCRVTDRQDDPILTPSEAEKGYRLEWTEPEQICRQNHLAGTEPWIMRDTAFIKMLIDKKIQLPEHE